MREDSASMKRRQRHFWKWLTETKKMVRGDVAKNFKMLNVLKAEHSEFFPDLYNSKKSFLVKQSIKEFHRKVLHFNKTMRESDNFTYCDQDFDRLPLFDGEIEKYTSEGFEKHYFAGFKSFTSHYGRVANHRNYQLYYIDRLFKSHKQRQRKNKYAIRKVIDDKKKYNVRVRAKEEENQRREEIIKLDKEKTDKEDKKNMKEVKKEEKRLKKLESLRLAEQKREARKLKKLEKDKRKKEESAKRERMKKIRFEITNGAFPVELGEEEQRLLTEDREERRQKRIEDREKLMMDDITLGGLIGTIRDATKVKPHDIGKLGDFKCKFCQALLWKKESKTICCNSGQVPPVYSSVIEDESIRELYEGKTKLSERFLDNIVGLNLVFSFTSFKTSGKLDNTAESVLCYKIQGKIYHNVGYLQPERLQNTSRNNFWNNTNDSFLDLYFYHDVEQQVKFRTKRLMSNNVKEEVNESVNPETKKRRQRETKALSENEEIVRMLFRYFSSHNMCLSGMLKELETSKELIRHYIGKNGQVPNVKITLKVAENVQTREHKGVYHLPTSSSAVGAIVNLDSSTKRHLQLTIESPNPKTIYRSKTISHDNFFYDAFQYPLLIPNGDVGYSHSLKLIAKKDKTRTRVRLSPASYYASMYMEREGVFNYVTKCRRLFQQFIVDNYVKVETMRLAFIEMNQNNIRKECSDVLKGENGKHKGQRIIIPPSYVGGPRYMKERQQDALAYVTNYGSPDFFITFTMNPSWAEFEEALLDTNSKSKSKGDRPDLISRIFKMKVDSLLEDLTVKCIFGKVKAYLYSIEWQKRGLPHVHILLWMRHSVNATLVSEIISAEIPDKNKEPKLFEIVTKNLIHGPCKGFDDSQLCCQGKSSSFGKNCCGKGFPKPCRNTLLYGNNGYPLYARRAIGEGGNSFQKKIKGKKMVTVDNSWVVPYNPYLCLKYNAHINVECSNSIKAIAYVTKYVNKGCDRILYSTSGEGEDQVVNEVKNYQNARYVNANEAAWKIFKFHIHKSFPSVTTLDLHLEGENEIFFRETENEEKLQSKILKDTQLIAFFKLCKKNDFAASLCYQEVPNHFIYDKVFAKWIERKTGTASLGRIRAVTSKTVELFYLRMLLTHVKGPTSYEDLRTVEGVVYPTFREAVKAMGLLNDEETWKKTIMEIINHTNNRDQLRTTYASMLVFSDLEDQSNIWEETKDLFASDYLHLRGLTEYNDEIYLDALDDIQEKVYNCGGGKIEQYGLPASRDCEKVSNIIRREKSYSKAALEKEIEEKKLVMNAEQKYCYETIMERVTNRAKYPESGFFINASGGTGKSFLLNAILDTVRSKGEIALAVASSGIAATVLHGGRTAHNMFKIPLMEHNEVKACSVKRNSEMARLIQMTSLIVWDEAVMANKNTITALDITLRDILGVDRFMGGVVFVSAGDFRQILPVVRGGGRSDELACCIKTSYFWDSLVQMELAQNMRLKSGGGDSLNKQFAQELLEMGTENNANYNFPPNFGVVVDNRKELVERVYDDFEDNFLNVSYFEKRAIISPTNNDVDCINDMVFKQLKTEEKVYLSEDTSVDNEMEIQTSVYNSINSPSLPLHKLKLKVGAVVMVIRNICPPKLCNGTRVIVTNLQKNIIVGKILTGSYRGEQVLLPRITLESTDTSVMFKRKQFPLLRYDN